MVFTLVPCPAESSLSGLSPLGAGQQPSGHSSGLAAHPGDGKAPGMPVAVLPWQAACSRGSSIRHPALGACRAGAGSCQPIGLQQLRLSQGRAPVRSRLKAALPCPFLRAPKGCTRPGSSQESSIHAGRLGALRAALISPFPISPSVAPVSLPCVEELK